MNFGQEMPIQVHVGCRLQKSWAVPNFPMGYSELWSFESAPQREFFSVYAEERSRQTDRRHSAQFIVILITREP